MKPKDLGLLLVVSALTIAIWIWNYRPTHPPSLFPAASVNEPGSSATSSWKTYAANAYAFTVEYPPEYRVEARSLNGAPYDEDFVFSVGSTTPLHLRLINLTRYLPTTNTPTIPEYVKTFRSFDEFTQTVIGGKVAYEYLIYGSASCSQQVVFIHEETLFDFSIETQIMQHNNADLDNNPVTRQIIESLRFLTAP
jgi:hypothetical protein